MRDLIIHIGSIDPPRYRQWQTADRVGYPADGLAPGVAKAQWVAAGRVTDEHEALSHWDAHAAAMAMPAELRPAVPPPTLGCQALNALQHDLVVFAGELAQAWERWDGTDLC